jgi:hypothetical protein
MTHTKTRQKYRNVQREPRMALSIAEPDNPYRFLEIRGSVEKLEDVVGPRCRPRPGDSGAAGGAGCLASVFFAGCPPLIVSVVGPLEPVVFGLQFEELIKQAEHPAMKATTVAKSSLSTNMRGRFARFANSGSS